MNLIFSKDWWVAAMVRALKTFAQTATALIGTQVVISDIDIASVLTTAAVSGLLSILTSIAGLPEVKSEEPECKGEDNNE